MFRLLVLIMILGFLFTNTSAQCTKDIECKGDRICVDGKCISPEDIENTTYQTESEAPIITKLSNEQKKKVVGVVLLNSLIPPLNIGHYKNGDNLIGGLFTAGTVVPFTLSMINYFIKHNDWTKSWQSEDSLTTIILYNESKDAEALYIATGITTGTAYVISTIIAGIRRSKIEKGVIKKKRRVSLIPMYNPCGQETKLSLNIEF